jgi:hypothetical protein
MTLRLMKQTSRQSAFTHSARALEQSTNQTREKKGGRVERRGKRWNEDVDQLFDGRTISSRHRTAKADGKQQQNDAPAQPFEPSSTLLARLHTA